MQHPKAANMLLLFRVVSQILFNSHQLVKLNSNFGIGTGQINFISSCNFCKNIQEIHVFEVFWVLGVLVIPRVSRFLGFSKFSRLPRILLAGIQRFLQISRFQVFRGSFSS